MKAETFKAAGCAAADKVKIEYEWTGYCRPDTTTKDQVAYKSKKVVCGSSKRTQTRYTDSACTTAEATPDEKNLTCGDVHGQWAMYTCGVAPPSFGEYSKYATNACATALYSAKFATGTCMLKQTSSGSGSATTWAAGSELWSIEGTASKTTGLKIKKYITDDCTGPSTDTEMGTQCSDHNGDSPGGWTNVVAGGAAGSAVASVANNIRVFSLVVGFFCTAAVLTYF